MKLALIDDQGQIIGIIDIDEYNLDKRLAAESLIEEIKDLIKQAKSNA